MTSESLVVYGNAVAKDIQDADDARGKSCQQAQAADCAGHRDADGMIAADRAPPELVSLMSRGVRGSGRSQATWHNRNKHASEPAMSQRESPSAYEESPEHPAGALAWAMQATAGVTGAALAALSARLPWHQDNCNSQDRAERYRQQMSHEASQKAGNLRRCPDPGSHRGHALNADHSQQDALHSTCSG